MKKFSVLLVSGLIMVGLAGTISISHAAPEPLARKIIVFKPGVLKEAEREALIKEFDGIKIKDLKLIEGKVAFLSKKAEINLIQRPGVLRIDEDVRVEALVRENAVNDLSETRIEPDYRKVISQLSQALPWGIDRVDAEKAWSITMADPIKVAIMDTGIDVKHPDLKDNLKGGVSMVGYTASFNDDNGHGTHVAGIAGALDNTIGVVGAGPKADLYAVKVLNRQGSGYLSDVIEGLDWAIANKMQVVNMSLGTSQDVLSFRDAIKKVNAAGVVQVAAAGNNGGAVIYPAAYPEVIAVSATNNADVIASWSSRGPEVDLAAPGVNIYSTYKGSKYKIISGTSMAAPHVAGSAALVLDTPIGAYDSDGDGVWDPNEVQKKLQDRATDLGTAGFDNLYGWGLVNAYHAVQP